MRARVGVIYRRGHVHSPGGSGYVVRKVLSLLHMVRGRSSKVC
jgi:hypothetical protein